MHQAQRAFAQAMTLGVLGAWECRLDGDALTWTDGVYDLFGFRRGSTLSRAVTLDHYEERSRREMQALRTRAISTGQGFLLDCRIRSADGAARWMRLIVGVQHEQGRATRIFGSKQDVTAEKGLWQTLPGLVSAQPQTRLADRRRSLEATLRELIGRSAGSAERFALVVLDIDRLAAINERHGRAAGDECLSCLSARLARLFPDALGLARIGDDEFMLLLRLPGGPEPLLAALEGAHRLLARPIPHRGSAIEIGISMGAALLGQAHRADPQKLFAQADSALYVARAAGRNRVRIFDGLIAPRPGQIGRPIPA